MFKKNISDGVGSRNGSNGTPLNPPLFWLDNIFKEKFLVKLVYQQKQQLVLSIGQFAVKVVK